MAIITVSRKVASLGDETSNELAKILGYKFVERKELEQCLINKGMSNEKLKKYDEKRPSFWASLSKDRDEYLEVITDVMPFLRAEDLAPKSYQGTLITPLAEQIYRTYSKHILKSGDKEIITTFIPILHQWMQAHPEYNSLIYYYVEMCNFANIPM